MSEILFHGIGAVSPAGWGVSALRDALDRADAIATKELSAPGNTKPFCVRPVPSPPSRPAFLSHPRLRRSSPLSHFSVAAAFEALGGETQRTQMDLSRIGIIFCVVSGCVQYTRRFYDETLRDPATASPLVFPETVFNAPASHLAAFFGTTARNYTLVGDQGAFLQGLALASDWLLNDDVDGCLIVGAEELDWLTAAALKLFQRDSIYCEGAGAVYVRRDAGGLHARLKAVSDPQSFSRKQNPGQAAGRMRAQLDSVIPKCRPERTTLLCDGLQGIVHCDAAEAAAWRDWPGGRLSPKRILGEGLMASSAWQCVAALDALRQSRYSAAIVSVVGCNQQAIGAQFIGPD